MAHHEEIQEIMETLRIATKHHIGEIMAARGHWKPGTSAVNNSYKVLCDLVGLRRLEKENGFFRVPGCRSEFKEHSQLLTTALTEIIKNYDAKIHREVWVDKIGLRVDAIGLLISKGHGFCFILEAMNQETDNEVISKKRVWEQWEDAREFLSRLFGYEIPDFEFITVKKGENPCGKLPSLPSSSPASFSS
jgi:hypothetical protein